MLVLLVATQSTGEPVIVPLLDGVPAEHCSKLQDLLGARELLAGSFGELARDYLLVHAWVEKRRSGEGERMLKRELLPLWRDVPATAVQAEDVAALIRNIALLRKAPVAANHVRLLVSQIYSFGISQVRVRFNPAHGVRVPGGKARTGSRWLSDEEIRCVWWGLEAEWSPESNSPRNGNRRLTSGDVFRALTRCRIVLFQRPGERISAKRQTYGRILLKAEIKPHLKKCWCIPPERNAEFVCCMEDVLEVYRRPVRLFAAGRLYGREHKAVARGGACAASGPAWRRGALRLRVSAQRRCRSVLGLRALGGLAPCAGDADTDAQGSGVVHQRFPRRAVCPFADPRWRK